MIEAILIVLLLWALIGFTGFCFIFYADWKDGYLVDIKDTFAFLFASIICGPLTWVLIYQDWND